MQILAVFNVMSAICVYFIPEPRYLSPLYLHDQSTDPGSLFRSGLSLEEMEVAFSAASPTHQHDGNVGKGGKDSDSISSNVKDQVVTTTQMV